MSHPPANINERFSRAFYASPLPKSVSSIFNSFQQQQKSASFTPSAPLTAQTAPVGFRSVTPPSTGSKRKLDDAANSENGGNVAKKVTTMGEWWPAGRSAPLPGPNIVPVPASRRISGMGTVSAPPRTSGLRQSETITPPRKRVERPPPQPSPELEQDDGHSEAEEEEEEGQEEEHLNEQEDQEDEENDEEHEHGRGHEDEDHNHDDGKEHVEDHEEHEEHEEDEVGQHSEQEEEQDEEMEEPPAESPEPEPQPSPPKPTNKSTTKPSTKPSTKLDTLLSSPEKRKREKVERGPTGKRQSSVPLKPAGPPKVIAEIQSKTASRPTNVEIAETPQRPEPVGRKPRESPRGRQSEMGPPKTPAARPSRAASQASKASSRASSRLGPREPHSLDFLRTTRNSTAAEIPETPIDKPASNFDSSFTDSHLPSPPPQRPSRRRSQRESSVHEETI
ncbi:hypothetical protein BJ508DRAFT_359730, partial [Ascobolus immersus RN42]